MTDLPPQTDWYGHATLLAAISAGVASVFRRGMSLHKVRNVVNDAVGPINVKVAVLESGYEEIERRLSSIETKLDRVLER